jgi:hypothetical protein
MYKHFIKNYNECTIKNKEFNKSEICTDFIAASYTEFPDKIGTHFDF